MFVTLELLAGTSRSLPGSLQDIVLVLGDICLCNPKNHSPVRNTNSLMLYPHCLQPALALLKQQAGQVPIMPILQGNNRETQLPQQIN